MILSPLQNTDLLLAGSWLQKRPIITQAFGENPDTYKQFGLNGHDGLDFRAPVGTSVFAPFESTIRIVDSGDKGYGRHVFLSKGNLQIVLGHLSEVLVKDGDHVFMGQKIAKTGNTGFSNAPHLHVGVRPLLNGQVQNYGNGFFGYYDFSDQVITWKGTLVLNTY